MLEILGKEYIFQHILQEYHKEQKELSYKIYVTDCLQLIASNTGRAPLKRYYDLITEKQDGRSGDEIARDTIAKAGLKVV